MSFSWGSKPTPEERTADRADRAASRDAINNARSAIQSALQNLKKQSAKEDYPVLQKMFKDMLDWLKANPTTNQYDINDYFDNNIKLNPLYQSVQVRKQWSDLFARFQTTTEARMTELKVGSPRLLASAQELLTPMVAYRDELLAWFTKGQMTLLPQDYEDKAIDVREAVLGNDGKGDVFKTKEFMDNKQLQVEVLTKQVEDNKINITRLIGTITKYLLIALLLVILCWGGFLGSCYSTNLNIYRSFEFRLYYAIYGALLWIFVVPYELVYRKWWLGEKAELHGYIPLVEGPITNWSWFGKTFFFFLEKKPMVTMTA